MEHRCSKCSDEMEVGFTLDRGRNAAFASVWIAGSPEKSWIGGVKVQGMSLFRVDTWRCKSCGYLESYALERVNA